MRFRHRNLEKKLEEYVDYFSVVTVTGPRQSGKSTLIRKILSDYQYVTFDNKVNRDLFYDDPEKFLRIYQNRVIFDEVQKVPEIFDSIKLLVDEDRETTGKFVLTASSQLTLSTKVSESLAGRVGTLVLLPYEWDEIPKKNQKESVFRGSYPELVQKNYRLFDDWIASYLETYVEKDLRSIANVGDLRDFQKLIQLLAANVSSILNLSSYAKILGVDVKTIKRWISILEASYIIFLLPPFYNNFGKRVRKSPKIYFYDVGIVSHLCGISSEELFEKGPMNGALFENYVIANSLKQQLHKKTHSKLYFFQESSGNEIDLIIDHRSHKEMVEIKSGETFRPKMTHAIEKFMAPEDKGFLVYRGRNIPHLENIHIVNYKDYFASFS